LKLQAIIITCQKELEAGRLSSSITCCGSRKILGGGAPGALRGAEAEAEGLCPHPSAGTVSSRCDAGKSCRQRDGGLGSAHQHEAHATPGPC